MSARNSFWIFMRLCSEVFEKLRNLKLKDTSKNFMKVLQDQKVIFLLTARLIFD
jgi:hypothetical protein